MKKITSYKDLIIWQKAMEATCLLYNVAKKLPKEETFALGSQMRRAAVSIPSNIAEGYGRQSNKEHLHFLTISRGSIYELETQLLLCLKLGYLKIEDILPLSNLLKELGRMSTSMINNQNKSLQVITNPN